MTTRVNKYLSESGYCSRREADRLIEANVVKINGVIATLGDRVTDKDIITVNDKLIETPKKDEFVYLLLNKPTGITSTTDQSIKGNIVDFMNYPQRIFHVGRLDKDSEGLIIMTNDGDIVNKILRSENRHEKEYIVKVDKPITKDFLDNIIKPVPLLGRFTLPCKVKQIDKNTFNIIITEGLNRQIRRMCSYFGYRVISLQRIRILNLKLDVPIGKYRHITQREKEELFNIINHE